MLTYTFSRVAVVQVLWTVKLLLKLTVPLSWVAFPSKRIEVNVWHNFEEVNVYAVTFFRRFSYCFYVVLPLPGTSDGSWYENIKLLDGYSVTLGSG